MAERSSVEREASGSFPLRGAQACSSSWQRRPSLKRESAGLIQIPAQATAILPCHTLPWRVDGRGFSGRNDARLCRFESCRSPHARSPARGMKLTASTTTPTTTPCLTRGRRPRVIAFSARGPGSSPGILHRFHRHSRAGAIGLPLRLMRSAVLFLRRNGWSFDPPLQRAPLACLTHAFSRRATAAIVGRIVHCLWPAVVDRRRLFWTAF